MEEACEILKTGTLQDVAEQCPTVFAKYHKGLAALKSITSKPKENWNKLEVIIKIGPPGCGKTRWAFENFPDLYRVSIPKKTGQLWFDGYEGQETILLDDFYGEIAYATLLHLLDGYPMQVQIKGGFVWKNWKRVIITSNEYIENWYPIRQIAALRRRVTDVTVTEVEQGNTELAPLLQDSDED